MDDITLIQLNAKPTVKFTKLRDNAVIPKYAKPGDAGADLVFCPEDGFEVVLKRGETAVLATGICIQLPDGWEAQVRSRSGLAAKSDIHVLNSPGTIDTGYRGELMAIIHFARGPAWKERRLGDDEQTVTIKPGERIAQLVVAPCFQAIFSQVEALDASDRGVGGFGSTGK